MSEEPVLIRRIEVYFDAERKPVKHIEDASFKYVTLYDEEGELTEQYQVEIVDGIDPELEEEATEEFREEEHPRDHGKFTDKGAGSKDAPALEPPSQIKDIRNNIFSDLLNGHNDLIKEEKEELKDLQEDLKKEPDNTMRYRVLFREIGRSEEKIRTSEKQIGLINKEKEFWNNPELLDLKFGKNTHKIGAKGYKSAINKKKGTPFDFFPKKDLSGHRGLAITPKNGGGVGMVSLDEYEEKMNGLTIIDSSLGSDVGKSVQESMNSIAKIWNNVFSDDDRNGVDVLQFRFSAKVIKKMHTVGGWRKRSTIQMDHVNDGKPIISEPSRVEILLNEFGDNTHDGIETMIHEMSHKRFHEFGKKNPEKMKRIISRVLALGKEGSASDYAETYWDDLSKIKAKNMFDDSKEAKDNIRRAEKMIANEAHSGLIAGMAVPVLANTYGKLRKDNVMKLNTIFKEEMYG